MSLHSKPNVASSHAGVYLILVWPGKLTIGHGRTRSLQKVFNIKKKRENNHIFGQTFGKRFYYIYPSQNACSSSKQPRITEDHRGPPRSTKDPGTFVSQDHLFSLFIFTYIVTNIMQLRNQLCFIRYFAGPPYYP